MQNVRAKLEVFPEIGTAPQRPKVDPPRDLLVAKTKLPYGPGRDGIVVKQHAKFPQPFSRLDNELAVIFKMASTAQHEEVDRILASRHADDPLDLNKRLEGENYRTPLFEAAYNKQHGMVKVLLKFKSDPSAADKLRRTPLHVAAINNSVTVCRELIEAKADPDLKDRYKRTPLDVAVAKQSQHTAEFLKEWLERRAQERANAPQPEARALAVAEKYPVLYHFLDGLGHAALLEPLLQIFVEEEEPPCMESLYILEPKRLVDACPDLLDRKQARALWKAIPPDVIRKVQRTAAGW